MAWSSNLVGCGVLFLWMRLVFCISSSAELDPAIASWTRLTRGYLELELHDNGRRQLWPHQIPEKLSPKLQLRMRIHTHIVLRLYLLAVLSLLRVTVSTIHFLPLFWTFLTSVSYTVIFSTPVLREVSCMYVFRTEWLTKSGVPGGKAFSVVCNNLVGTLLVRPT